MAKILELRIYDRWGELVFYTHDILPNHPTLGWDGYFKGKPMNPAVFVYWTRVQLVNGDKVLIKGDITLVR